MRLFKFRRDPTDPVDRVDRYWRHRRLRLMAGLDLADDFSSLRGAIVRAQGEGKYLHFQPLSASSVPLRPEWASACRKFCKTGGSAAEFQVLKNDLATIQAELLIRLRAACGSLGESLLAVAVADPGLWTCDFDGKPMYESFCNPDILSTLSGVSVIDALPAKDLVAGGHGWPLTPLACWLVAADRSSPEAEHSRLLVRAERGVEVFFLPVSDGLDDVYPRIAYGRIPMPIDASESDGEPDAADEGNCLPEMTDEWSRVFERLANSVHWNQLEAELTSITESMARNFGISRSDLWSSARHWLRQQSERLAREFTASHESSLQILIAGEDRAAFPLRESLVQMFPDASIESTDRLGLSGDSLPAVFVAALGAMHVDQMPADLPWLTGVESPRILGRLTPGSPKQWRMLLREMADHHPGAMRLRDAV
jgi:1,6-anhydro-N-acetylmuramate kinase